MPLRYYILPEIQIGNISAPKYFKTFLSPPGYVLVDSKSYGVEPYFIIAANLNITDHSTLSAQIDVFSFPEDIDEQVSLNIIELFDKINASKNILTVTTTYREALRFLLNLFHVAQMIDIPLREENKKIFTQENDRNSGISGLSIRTKKHLDDELDRAKINRSGIRSNSSMIDALHMAAIQLPNPVFNGAEI
jgi:hypothetical protein